jgi:hypothetical protein
MVVPALDHELVDDAVESRALVTEALLARSQSTRSLSACEENYQVEGRTGSSRRSWGRSCRRGR